MKKLLTLAPGLVLQAVLFAGPGHAQYGPPPADYQQSHGWDAPPPDYNDDLRRHAFHDGIEAARRDFQAQRPADPATHEEFRHPHVPPPAAESYRDAYRHGYFAAMQHLRGNGGPVGAPPAAGYAPGGWDAPPAEFNDDLRRHAFHDGIEAARHDVAQRLPLNPDSHEEFRHPQVPYPARDSYREAYRRGYQMAAQHMQGGGGPR